MLKKQAQPSFNIYLFIILIGLFIVFAWSLSKFNFFLMDDYSTITSGIFTTPSQLFSIFPRQRYNDRPVGVIFVALLYKLFGMNHQGYHAVFFAVHATSCLLTGKIAMRLYKKWDINIPALPYLAVGIFAFWPNSIMCVHWVAAVYDLLCCFFVLCSIWSYFKAKDNTNYYAFYSVSSIVFYAISLRCKEMSLLLPIVYLIFDIFENVSRPVKRRITPITIISTIWMLIYIVRLFSLPAEIGNEYSQSFSVSSIISCAIHYIALYFDIWHSNMVFVGWSVTMIPGLAAFFAMCFFVIWSAFKKRLLLPLLSLLSAGFLLSPVLTIPQMQHFLYLYLPSVFLAIAFAIPLGKLFCVLKESYVSLFISFCLILVIATNFLPGPHAFKYWWLSMAHQDQEQLEELFRFGEPVKYCSVYVRGAGSNYNVIYPYGPGNSMRALYGRNDFFVNVVDDFPSNLAPPYMLIDYCDDHFSLIESHLEYSLQINQIYSSMGQEHSMAIAVECSPIYPDLSISIDGLSLPTTIGKDFISAELPKTYSTGDEINVIVSSDEFNIVSNPVRFILQ